jgi:CRISPR system Cascade subunit CasD
MPTLLLRLIGPMQSWGTTSRFDQRDTGKEPSKSGVIGLLAAALGIDRENWADLKPLADLKMAVRHDRTGMPKRDYQTAGCASSDTIIKANGSPSKDGVVSQRHYLADAAFLVGLEGDNSSLLERAHEHLKNPTWMLFLGRKSYLPSEPIWIENGVQNAPLREVIIHWPWIATLRKWEETPEKLSVSWESEGETGVLKMDQRRFGSRFVQSELISFPKEVSDVSA